MSLRRGMSALGDRSNPQPAGRAIVGGIIVALIVAACSSGGAPSASALQAATAAPTVEATSSPSPTVAPTASPTASPTPSPTASTAIAGTFALGGLSAVIDKPAQTIDTSTFTKTFASETPAIYVLYELSPGSAGKVVSTWKKGSQVVNTVSLDYPADAPWAYFELSYQDGFIPGDYVEEIKVVESGDTLSLPFTVTGPRKAPASPTPVPSGTSAFTLLKMATSADSSKSGPDPSTFTDTFASSAAKLYVVFSLESDLSGKVVCTMTANGSEAVKPISLQYGTGNSWGDFEISSGGSFPVGDYVATLTYSPSGEVVTIPFTVN